MSPSRLVAASLALMIPTFLFFLSAGSVAVPLQVVLSPSGMYKVIVWDIRLPTALAAALIGAILAVSGAVMQLLYRNPLMDPYISGTASGAAFGAVLAYLIAVSQTPAFIFYQTALAFVFALAAGAVAVAVGRGGIYTTVVAGVAMSYLFSALATLTISYLSAKMPQIPPITFWLFGYIDYVDYVHVALFALATGAVVGLAYAHARRIDLVALSDEMAHVRGIEPRIYRLAWLAGISLATALIVSNVGVVGFVGLMVPHLARMILKNGSATALIPASAALGALALTFSGAVARGALGFTTPVTAVTSIMAIPIMILALGHVREGG